MSIKDNFPALKPSLLLDFANTKTLDPRVTFARASEARYYDGVSVAKAEENLLLRSQEFDNAAWTKFNTTVTANAEIAPDGTTTAETITASSGASQKYLNQAFSLTAGEAVASVYVKAGTNSFFQISFGTQSSTYANFDVSTGATGTSGSVISSSIESIGGGWHRCVVVFTNVNATSLNLVLVSSDSALRLESWTAAGTETVFLWGAQLEQRSSVTAYTPTTDQPITRYQPVLQTAEANVARSDHDPVTGESLGRLVEESRTNLLTYSEDFSNATWNKTNATISANQVVAPDGTLTADKLVEDTATGNHTTYQNITTSATPYYFSVFLKAAERSRISLWVGATTLIDIDLSSGAVIVSGNNVEVVDVGGGWFRVVAFRSNIDTNLRSWGVFVRDDSGNLSYTGDGYSGIYVWGAQLEVGSFPTSYIKTEASQVTRAADNASMTGTNFSEWYRADEGTFYIEMRQPVANTQMFAVAATDGVSKQISLYFTGASVIGAYVVDSAGVQANIGNTAVSANVFGKSAVAYKRNDFAISTNGVSAATDTSGTVPIVDRLVLRSSGSFTFRKIAYYPQRLSNTNLQALTGS